MLRYQSLGSKSARESPGRDYSAGITRSDGGRCVGIAGCLIHCAHVSQPLKRREPRRWTCSAPGAYHGALITELRLAYVGSQSTCRAHRTRIRRHGDRARAKAATSSETRARTRYWLRSASAPVYADVHMHQGYWPWTLVSGSQMALLFLASLWWLWRAS